MTGSAILAVSLNPALDVTYAVGQLRSGATHRVDSCEVTAGGKAVNVARTLAALGQPVTVTGFAGGGTGAELRDRLRHPMVADHFVGIAGETRRTVVIREESGVATGLWESGPEVSSSEWGRLRAAVAGLVSRHSVVVLSGSLPPGVPTEAYGQLVALAHTAGCRVVVDAEGSALEQALRAKPEVVKPNQQELTGVASLGDQAGVLPAAVALRRAGAGTVVASLGDQGLLAVTPGGSFRVRPPEVVRGNPTGAGDAVVAAIAHGLAAGHDWPSILKEAVAVAAAAVVVPTAGAFSAVHHQLWRSRALLEEVRP